jgi:energy-coupling factor transporter transmembrane protein EcfT
VVLLNVALTWATPSVTLRRTLRRLLLPIFGLLGS